MKALKLTNISKKNFYIQNAITHNQSILEVQDQKLHALMENYDSIYNELLHQRQTQDYNNKLQRDILNMEMQKKRERITYSRERDVKNLMMLNNLATSFVKEKLKY